MFIVYNTKQETIEQFDTLQEATDYMLDRMSPGMWEYCDTFQLFEAKELAFEIERKIIIKPD